MATKIIAVPIGWVKGDLSAEGEKMFRLEYERGITSLDEYLNTGWSVIASNTLRVQGWKCILYTLYKEQYTPKA